MTDNTLKLINEYLMQGGYSPGIDSEALESEARLIAAAPDLLAALYALVQDCDDYGLTDNDAHLREARAAIAKAKGQ